jgi:hypothetical protein
MSDMSDDPTDDDDQPITEQEVAAELVHQHERETRPRPLTDMEHREQVERDARAVEIFGPEAWPPTPPDDET